MLKHLLKGHFSLSIITTTYYTAFLFLFVVGGAMAFVGIPFRPFMVAGLALIIFFFRNIKLNRIFFLYFLLLFEILISAILNNSSTIQVVLFLRNLIISYLIYFLASNYLIPEKSERKRALLKWCSVLGLFQLPIVFFQKVYYEKIVKISAIKMSYWDIGSGSFFIKNDSAMSIFLLGLIIYYLFNYTNDKFRNIKVIVYVLAIFIAGSRIMQLSTLLVVSFYFLRNLNSRSILLIVFLILIGIGGITQTKAYQEIQSQLTLAINKFDFSKVNKEQLNAFQEGKYSRAAAVLYYISQPLKLTGDGPSAYYDVIEREHILGNTGHVFTFYSEVGLIGLLLSYLILYEFSKSFSNSNRKASVIYFISLVLLSITSNIFSDAGILLAYFTLLWIQEPIETVTKEFSELSK